jgi:hypothetical protein
MSHPPIAHDYSDRSSESKFTQEILKRWVGAVASISYVGVPRRIMTRELQNIIQDWCYSYEPPSDRTKTDYTSLRFIGSQMQLRTRLHDYSDRSSESKFTQEILKRWVGAVLQNIIQDWCYSYEPPSDRTKTDYTSLRFRGTPTLVIIHVSFRHQT